MMSVVSISYLLGRKYVAALAEKDIDINDVWFQQDGASPHTDVQVVNWLQEKFGNRFISFETMVELPILQI